MCSIEETIRWPIRLSHGAIIRRLVHIREVAASCGLGDLSEHFAGVEHMPAAKIALNVAESLYWLLGKAEHQWLTKRLEMVAMNLGNLCEGRRAEERRVS